MNTLDISTSFEKHICDKADGLQIPIGATFELLPVCNMNCSMCYVRMDKKDVEKQGGILSLEEWIQFAEIAQKKGVLFLLLTGGEPLLFPKFKEYYLALKNMGFIVSINTNGTLIDEEVACFFAQNPPRRLNISIYGASAETYQKMCNYSQGFVRLKKAIGLLKEYNIDIKLNYTVTPYNIEYMDEIYKFADENGLPIETVYYTFPPERKTGVQNIERLTPKQAAWIKLKSEIRTSPYANHVKLHETIKKLESGELKLQKPDTYSSFTCRAGNSTFWINWKGEMIPCGMMNQPAISLKINSFEDAWEYTKKQVKKTRCSLKCRECYRELYCGKCAAAALAETNDFSGTPDYLCELAKWYEIFLEKYIKEGKLEEYLE